MNDESENMTARTVRLPEQVRAEIRRRAHANRRTFNAELVVLLEQRIAQAAKEGQAA